MKKNSLFSTLLFAAFISATSLQAQTVGKLWGTTTVGGDSGGGVVFNFDPLTGTRTDSLKVQFSDAAPTGPQYTNLIQATDGNFYGLTNAGGTLNQGTLFRMDATGHVTILVNFTDANGANPGGSLIQASDGNLYGMTNYGGTNYYGTIFQCTLAGVLTTIVNLDGTTQGGSPNGGLMQATDGNLYGMTSTGGTSNYGTLFKCSTAGVLTVLVNFNSINGANPNGDLMQASDGNLYGMTQSGGANADGTLFQCTTAGALNTLVSFSGTSDGGVPRGRLIQATDGNLYGMTEQGGGQGDGTLFKCTLSGVLTTMVSFTGINGSLPWGSLIQAKDNNFYGMTQTGGTTGNGTLFQYTLAGALNTLYSFKSTNDGGKPQGSLMQASDNNLYGMTFAGGSAGLGVIFEAPYAGTPTTIYNMGSLVSGYTPLGNVIQANDGNLYGMTQYGGTSGAGTIFKTTPSGKVTVLVNFTGPNGSGPWGSLMQANDGNLYGMTYAGGTIGFGTIFKCTLAGVITTLYNFDSATGSSPKGSLMQANDGNLYGMTALGGASGVGVIFKCSLTGAYTLLQSFNFANNGAYPFGSLIQATDGNLYGMTSQGGINTYGTVFKCPLAGGITDLVSLTAIQGIYPDGSLLQATDGNLYGMTNSGGTHGGGTLFKWNMSLGQFDTLLSFGTADTGSGPYGSLIQGADGNLYGMTNQGGTIGYGVIFQYNYAKGSYTDMMNLYDDTTGYTPEADLCEVMSPYKILDTVKCGGNQLTATVRGGKAPFTYMWSTGPTTQTITGITAAGIYSVTVKDSRGIVMMDTITLKAATSFKVTVTGTNVSCNGSCNGTGAASITGGTPPYTYAWSTGRTTNFIYNLCPASYTCVTTDNAGCKDSMSVTVTQPVVLAATATSTNASCGTINGTATASGTGGNIPYKYSWTTTPVQSTAMATGLPAGTYTVTLTDGNGCTATANATISAASGPVITPTVTNSTCKTSNGKVTLSITGGTAPFRYSWNNGDTLSTDSNMAAGSYIITVKDVNGCSTFQAVNINDVGSPVISVVSSTNEKCSGDTLGAITTNVTGGTLPYTYYWSNSGTKASISNVSAGPYQLTVTDAAGCVAVQTLSITEPTALSATTSTVQATCATGNGSADINVAGGSTPYTYKWSTGLSTTSATNLLAGTYSVVVTDNNGCSLTSNVSVSNAGGPLVTTDSVIAMNCITKTQGAITIAANGGTPPYSYLWSNSKTTQNINNLTSGNYYVTVTDAAGCVGTTNADITTALPSGVSICMVSVNPANDENILVWDSLNYQRIAKYLIYKESTTPGIFNIIGSVAGNRGSFVDTAANCDVRSWDYEISELDSCGQASPISESVLFKTIHLTTTLVAGNKVNLVWDNFEGSSFSYYIVYRDSIPGIAKDSIARVSSNTYGYVDSPPTTKNWYYHVGIGGTLGCTILRPVHGIETVNYNASKSNTGNVTFVNTGIPVISSINSLQIYPNPNRGVFNMSMNLSKEESIDVTIYNEIGQTIEAYSYGMLTGNVNKQYDMSNYSKGVYLIKVATTSGVQYRKIVIE